MMNIATYLKIYQLLKHDTTTQEQRRAFALQHHLDDRAPLQQLIAWLQYHKQELPRKDLASQYTHFDELLLLLTVLIAFAIGFGAAEVVLHYTGKEPVNIIHFLFISFLLPLFSMGLSLFAFIKPTFFSRFSLSSLIQKLLQRFEDKKLQTPFLEYPHIFQWLLIVRIHIGALWFALGILSALLLNVTTQDIAFSWSSTLSITPHALHQFLSTLALPWSWAIEQGVPSLSLIEQSHYFRLGNTISQTMLQQPQQLGQWWKFLALQTLFYAVFLRLILYGISRYKLHKTLQKTLLSLPEAQTLLHQLNTPIIQTQSPIQEQPLCIDDTIQHTPYKPAISTHYETILGYAFNTQELPLFAEVYHITAKTFKTIGGNNTLQEDDAIIQNLQGEIALFVKSWEVPTMDFFDTMEAITQKTPHITLYLIGYKTNNYKAKQEEQALWEKMLTHHNFTNVRIHR